MNTPKQPTLAELTSRAMTARATRPVSDEIAGDVEPHEVLSGIRVDSQAAWADSQLAGQLLGTATEIPTQPADWATFVGSSSPRLGIPLAVGQFPQRLRDVSGLFAAKLVETGSPSIEATAVEGDLNQQAANLWLAGRSDAALAMWQNLPAGPVASFNIGMALLMLGRTKSAVPHLASAAESLPETSGWQHLAALYLTVARLRM